jgi:nicotinate-nucleotide adenylyltransferase
MKITLFGGTFDPPHLGHSKIAQALLDQHRAEEVWFLPVGEHAFEKKASPASVRVAMLEQILEKNQRIELYEIEHPGMSITYETLMALATKYPEHQFSFVIGSDNLEKFDLWHQYRELLKRFPFFVYPREGADLQPLYPGMTVLTGVEPVSISSTQVRSAIQSGDSIENLVHPKVAEYISKERLYKKLQG